MRRQIWSGRDIQSCNYPHGLRVHQNHFQVDSVQGEIISALTQPKLNAFCVDSACSECEACQPGHNSPDSESTRKHLFPLNTCAGYDAHWAA
jgi:hypothetical protein